MIFGVKLLKSLAKDIDRSLQCKHLFRLSIHSAVCVSLI